MLNKRISQDDKVAKLSIEATLLYTWCIPYLDYRGRLYGDIWTLKAIVPNIKELTPLKIEKCISEWVETDLVIYYGDGQKYLEFKGFTKNQTLREGREADSEIPAPTELQQNSSETTAKDKLSKDKIREDKISYVDFENSTLTYWNSFCDKNPTLSKIKEISTERRVKLKKRFENATFKDFEAILKASKNQPFLFGENDRKWKFTFDWLIENNTNYLKILENRYASKSRASIKAADTECKICEGSGFATIEGVKNICPCRKVK